MERPIATKRFAHNHKPGRGKHANAWKSQKRDSQFPTAAAAGIYEFTKSAKERTGRKNSQTACRKTCSYLSVVIDRSPNQDQHARTIIVSPENNLH